LFDLELFTTSIEGPIHAGERSTIRQIRCSIITAHSVLRLVQRGTT